MLSFSEGQLCAQKTHFWASTPHSVIQLEYPGCSNASPRLNREPLVLNGQEACQGELVFKWWYSESSAAGSTPCEAICSEQAPALSSPRQGELASADTGSQSVFEWMSDLLGCCGHSYSNHPAVSLTGGLASNVEKWALLFFFFCLTNARLLDSIYKQNKMTQGTSTREGPHILWHSAVRCMVRA